MGRQEIKEQEKHMTKIKFEVKDNGLNKIGKKGPWKNKNIKEMMSKPD